MPRGKTSLILEFACDNGDQLWSESDDRLLARCLPHLTDLGLLRPGQEPRVLDCFSTYLGHAYPVSNLD